MHLKESLWTTLGILFVVIAAIGVVLPLLPTTPFLLLAAACFLKGSMRMHKWLLTNRVFGKYISDYRTGGGMAKRAKVTTLIMLWSVMIYSSWFIVPILVAKILLLAIAGGVSYHIISLPTSLPD
jgi:uncharacterized membrane protein YbaN (DUF454 family)